VQIVAGELVLLVAGVGCGTLIARFALAQLFRAAGMSRRKAKDPAR
jgi:hypothetical protein